MHSFSAVLSTTLKHNMFRYVYFLLILRIHLDCTYTDISFPIVIFPEISNIKKLYIYKKTLLPVYHSPRYCTNNIKVCRATARRQAVYKLTQPYKFSGVCRGREG
jgi:hypothetical protein